VERDHQRRVSAVAALFDRVATNYDSTGVAWFTPIARALVAAVDPKPGQRALDIGCGRGAALFALADAVGPHGRVTGIDLAPGMVREVRAEAAARGLTTVDIQLMDASRIDIAPLGAGTRDVVVASMVAFFMPDPVAALRSWRDLLAPGGRLAISSMGRRDAGWQVLEELFLPHLPPAMREGRLSPVARRFATADGVGDVLTDAGYRSVRVSTVDIEAVFDGPEQWRAWSRSHAGRGMWDSLPATELPAVVAAAERHLEGLRGADGRIRLGQQILLAVAEPAIG
jgi:ubiquinone/menaquinone biosynthesis C-methylase UbiE